MIAAIQVLRGGRLLALTAFASTAGAQTPPSYAAEFLGSATSVTALNDAGVAVGWTSGSGPSLRGWVAGGGIGMTLLPLPPGRASSMAYGINDLGMIVGDVASGSSPEFSGVAALWTPNGSGGYVVQELGSLPGTSVSHALALNNLGDVVGFSVSGIFHKPVLFSAPGGIMDLSASGIGDPKSINDQRVLVDGSAHRLDLNTMVVQNLGVPTGLPSNYVAVYTNAINASNQVVGAAVLATGGNCSRQATRYTDGIGWQIFSSCGQYNDAHDINDSGDVVMRILTVPYVRFEGLGTYSIESLIANSVGHWAPYNTFYSVTINNARQIVLPASNTGTGESGMVLLTPITSAGTTLCFGDGSGAACPCGNASPPGAGEGCLQSTGVGAKLAGTGSALVANDDLVLHVSQAPPLKTALFLQGAVGAGVPFRDGVLCLASPTVRLQLLTTDAGGAAATSVSIVTHGGIAPGMTRNYQTWFRDPAGPCGTGSNISSALQIAWQ